MHDFAMLRSAGQKLYQIYHWTVHYIRINRYSTVIYIDIAGRYGRVRVG
eukprot:COSAG02_NODE_39026_length_422_cov_0.482972_1_plen_48_part_01